MAQRGKVQGEDKRAGPVGAHADESGESRRWTSRVVASMDEMPNASLVRCASVVDGMLWAVAGGILGVDTVTEICFLEMAVRWTSDIAGVRAVRCWILSS